MQKRIKIELCGNDLEEWVIAEMWAIYEPYYNYSEKNFRERIDRNTHYALYRRNGRIVGFTGLRIQKIDLAGDKFLTIYFGQTVVSNQVRGCGLINRTGLLLMTKFWRAFLSRKVVFWADALTYRAYLVFAKNLLECYPRRHQLLPLRMKNLRDYLGHSNYGHRYCPSSGTVAKDSFLVNDPQMIIAEEKLRDPDIYLFAKANPEYLQGSGLLTMGPVTWENLAFMVKKAFLKLKAAPMMTPANSLQTEYNR
jgi:hypothetical protein